MDNVREYQQLFGETARLSLEYSRLPDYGGSGPGKDSGYGLAIKGVCSDGSVDQPGGRPYEGKMSTLMNNSTSVTGSLSLALKDIKDLDVNYIQSEWGCEQISNLQNICNIFGFTYTGPVCANGVIPPLYYTFNSYPPDPDNPPTPYANGYFSIQNDGGTFQIILYPFDNNGTNQTDNITALGAQTILIYNQSQDINLIILTLPPIPINRPILDPYFRYVGCTQVSLYDNTNLVFPGEIIRITVL